MDTDKDDDYLAILARFLSALIGVNLRLVLSFCRRLPTNKKSVLCDLCASAVSDLLVLLILLGLTLRCAPIKLPKT